jgi:hypothetical protein
LTRARIFLIASDLDPDDYRKIKIETQERINRLEAMLTTESSSSTNVGLLFTQYFYNKWFLIRNFAENANQGLKKVKKKKKNPSGN